MIEPAARDGIASAFLPSTGQPRRLWPAVLAIVSSVLLAFWPMLVGQTVFQRDSALWLFPARWFVRQSLLAGSFRAGIPTRPRLSLLADPQYGVFYPPNWLFLLVPDGMVAHLMSWLSLAHLVWGGIGTMLLARGLGACPVGSAVAASPGAFGAHHLGLGHRTASPRGSLDSVGGARISTARPQAGRSRCLRGLAHGLVSAGGRAGS